MSQAGQHDLSSDAPGRVEYSGDLAELAALIKGRAIIDVDTPDEPASDYLVIQLSGPDAPTLYVDAPTLYRTP